jgi:glycosyltransferase involved in cell wall biosynthesis
MLITVVSVTRNDRPGIARTIASVRQQSDVHVQHIVVDGASTDGTAEWLAQQAWPAQDTFISEPDSGIYDGMNKGAALAEGELIVFLNGGDRFPSADIASMVAADYAQQHWRWAYGITVLESPDGTVSRIHQMAPFSKVRLGLGLSAVPHQAMWMQTALFRELGGFRLASGLSADMDLCWRAAHIAEPRLLPSILASAAEGGVSAVQSPGFYAREMRRNVKDSGYRVVGNQALDAIASAVVVGLTSVVQIVPTWWARRRAPR